MRDSYRGLIPGDTRKHATEDTMKRTVILTAIAALAFSMALANGPRFQSSTRTTYGAAFGATPVRAGTILATSLHDDAAALLGLTPTELTALRLEGKTLAEIATDLGRTPRRSKRAWWRPATWPSTRPSRTVS